MELTRRDAAAALAAAGVAVGGAATVALDLADDAADDGGDDADAEGEDADGGGTHADGPLDDRDLETLVAAAGVLYPAEVEGIEEFVRRYARGRAADRPEHAAGIAEATAYLDAYAESWHDQRFATLDAQTRDAILQGMRVDEADPDPDGSDAERVRYFVVNDLLFALYTSPTGGELVGLENPMGHPGGIASYQRGPDG